MFGLFDSFDYFVKWCSALTLNGVIAVFWFLFFIEFPRYYILPLFVLFKRWLLIKNRKKTEKVARYMLLADNPFVSIVVPGKNEGENIYKLVKSLKEQTYQNFELIIIDDGSDDNTPIIVGTLLENGLVSKYYRAEFRGGKASAANLSLFDSISKYIIHLDADSSLDRDAIEKILIPFYIDKKTGAVGGCVKVRNQKENICTSLQSMEYLDSIMLGRIVSSDMGIYRTISGAFGAFDINVLKQVGAWDIGPGLDGDITQKIRKSGFKIVFNHQAICQTNVPTGFYFLFKQRLRWSKSIVRFRLRKHSDVFNPFSSNFRMINFVSNFENLLFSLFFDFLWLYYLITLILFNTLNLIPIFILKFMIMMVLNLFSFCLCMIVTERKREEFYLIMYVPLYSFYSGYFLRVTRVISAIQEIFFFRSYKDPWNPEKTSVHARAEKI